MGQHTWTPTSIGATQVNEFDVDRDSHNFIDEFLYDIVIEDE